MRRSFFRGDRCHDRLIPGTGDEDQEFIAAGAGDRVHFSKVGRQPSCHQGEEPITRAVSQRIISKFETVQIEKEHSKAVAVALGARKLSAQAVHEQEPVRECRQRVVRCLVLQLRINGLQPECVAASSRLQMRIIERGNQRNYQQTQREEADASRQPAVIQRNCTTAVRSLGEPGCRHARVVHGRDACSHDQGTPRQACSRQRCSAGEEQGEARGQYGDSQRQQGCRDVIGEGNRERQGQHTDEMHGPNPDAHRQGAGCQPNARAAAFAGGDPCCKTQGRI